MIPNLNRAARRKMARCKHDLRTKTDGNGNPWLTVCMKGCGYEEAASDDHQVLIG